MDKKNLFKKGNNRCIMFSSLKRKGITMKNMDCMSKNGNCKDNIVKSNCRFIQKEIIEMKNKNKTSLEIKRFILTNMI